MSEETKRAQQQSTTTAPPPAPYYVATRSFLVHLFIVGIILALLNSCTRSYLPKTFISGIRPFSTTTSATAMKIIPRPWSARGLSDHDWLYSFHTFSFASHYDPAHESFGPLRVINEDRVKPTTGFGTHSHAEFLIFSYIVNGTLEHRDSMGNLENLKRGEVQFTSAGTGIRHSEYNRDKNDEVHFLQIWAKPNIRGLKPHYETKKFTDAQKTDKLCRIMEYTKRLGEKTTESPIGLQADLSMDASILSPGKKVVHDVVADGPRKIYLQVVMGGREQPKEGGAKIKIGETVLGEGDGAYVKGVSGPAGKIEVESVGDKPAEFLLFDMGGEDV